MSIVPLKTHSTMNSFPRQKRSRKEKNKKFYIDCVEAGDIVLNSDINQGLRATFNEKLSNYNLWNDIVDSSEVEATINPNKIEADFQGNYRNYPIANSSVNLLLGEERKRFFAPMAVLSNPDLISSKVDEITGMMNEQIVAFVVSNMFDPNKAEEQIKKQSRYFNMNYRDRRERMANQIIQYGLHHLKFRELFSRNFEDLLISSEEIAISEILSGEPILRKGNPLNIFTLRSGDSYRFEDADMIMEIEYVPIGRIIDDHHDELTSKQINQLEEAFTQNREASNLFTRQLKNPEFDMSSWLDQAGGIGNIIQLTQKQASYFGGSFDTRGNVRRLRVLWKGLRKLGVLEYIDETGDLQKRYVDEDYEVDETLGEKVKWIWVSEWNEGIKIGEDIYVKLGPRPVQFRSAENPSKSYPGIVGTIFNVNNSPGKSLLGMMKPYQLMYNFYMHKLREELKTYKGKVARINTAMIPSQFTMDQFLFYLDQMKIIFENPFNEGNRGAATGKLAGSLNQSGNYAEFGDAQVIQQLLAILTFLENRIMDISGVTPQRKGAVENRETVGGVERAVTQSSLNTEKYFGVHDNFKTRAIEAFLETAKVAWKGKKFKRQFILDDGSQAILDFDSDLFVESSYGVYITSATEDHEMMQTLRSLAQPLIQNGGTISMVMDLYRTKDPALLQRKMETYEQEIKEELAKQREAEIQMQQAQLQAQANQEEAKLQQAELENIRDNKTKLEIALLQAGESANTKQLELDFKDKELELKSKLEEKKIAASKQKATKTT